MNKLRMLGMVALVVIFAGPAGAQPMAVQGPPGGINVNVVNPPDSPVPVEVQGVPEVDVSNTPETPLHVLDVDRRAQIPYIHGCSITLEDGDRSGFCSFQDVDAGKRLVVEFMSGEIRYPAGHTGQVRVVVGRPSGFFTSHYLAPTIERANINGDDYYVVSQPLRIYIQPEGYPGILFSRAPDDNGTAQGDFWITGYMVDVDEE